MIGDGGDGDGDDDGDSDGDGGGVIPSHWGVHNHLSCHLHLVWKPGWSGQK